MAIGNAFPAADDVILLPQAFRWTPTTGAVGLGTLPGAPSSDSTGGMTPDGKIIIGQSGDRDMSVRDIYRWTEATGMVILPKPPGYERCSPAYQQGHTATPGSGQFFRWTGVSAPIGVPLPAGGVGEDESMTDDGAAIYGTWGNTNGTTGAFRWTESTGSVDISLPGYTNCTVRPVSGRNASADASVVIGQCTTPLDGGADEWGAFRWTQATGAVPLLPLPGNDGTRSESISADGAIIVGRSLSPSANPLIPNTTAVVWDANGKATSVADLLTSLGADLQGFELFSVTVSVTDARLITGLGKNAAGDLRGWFARLP